MVMDHVGLSGNAAMQDDEDNCLSCGQPFDQDRRFPCQLPCYHFICLQCRDHQMSSFSYRSSSDSSKSAGDGCEDPQSTSSGDEHFSKVKCPICKTKHKIDTFR